MVLCCTIHISRLAWPRSVPAPSRIQTPDNCPPQLLPHAPPPSYPKDDKKNLVGQTGTCQISAICHARCVCNLQSNIFCPLSHRQPRQVKTCQPGRLRWSIFLNVFQDWQQIFYGIVPWFNQNLELFQNTTSGCAENVEKTQNWNILGHWGYPTLAATDNLF